MPTAQKIFAKLRLLCDKHNFPGPRTVLYDSHD